jgi:hypothetical protein
LYYGYNHYALQNNQERAPQWNTVYQNLYYSLYAEQMLCALSSEFYHINDMKDLKGNGKMHNHLVPASYHRVTAVGSVIRLLNGEQEDTIIKTLRACMNNAQRQDKGVMKGLRVMRDNAPKKYRQRMRQLIQWQKAAEYYLQQAEDASKR